MLFASVARPTSPLSQGKDTSGDVLRYSRYGAGYGWYGRACIPCIKSKETFLALDPEIRTEGNQG